MPSFEPQPRTGNLKEQAPRDLRVRRVIFYTDPPLRGTGGRLRQAVTAQYPDEPTLHNHHPDGSGRMRLPLVRYLVHEGRAHLIGVGAGVPRLESVYEGLNHLRLGHETFEIAGREVEERRTKFGAIPRPVAYRSITPWIALNQRNHRRFTNSRSAEGRRDILENVIVGNLLSLAKSRDYWVERHLKAKVHRYSVSEIEHKETSLMGFRVVVTVNFLIPEWVGIGKLASKGFGILTKMDLET